MLERIIIVFIRNKFNDYKYYWEIFYYTENNIIWSWIKINKYTYVVNISERIMIVSCFVETKEKMY